MKRWMACAAIIFFVHAAAALAGGMAPGLGNQELGKSSVVVADVVETTAVVEAVDYTKRTLRLKIPREGVLELKVDREVKNLEFLKKGDPVKAAYTEPLAVFMRKADAPPSPAESRLVSVVPKGRGPAVLLAETVQMAAVVEAVDAKTRKLTLKVAGGRTRVLRVDNGLKHLDGIKKGDAVVIRMIEAIAIKVEKRK
ncbi:MAG: hypothetical protein HY895_02535 [Deltaproteobacteria bacterium]|nr:hypothetical protein [Deltaproteobacteria bacterium]